VDSFPTAFGSNDATLWTVVVAVVMILGLMGVVLPVLPGLLLIWAAALFYGFMVGFGTLGWTVVALLSVLVVAGAVKSVMIPRRAAAASGASGWAQVGAVVGGVIGFFVIPVLGLILGALAGLLAVEYVLKGDWNEALVAVRSTARGFGVSVVIDLILGMIMIVAWSVWAASVLF
jgi:uncharacterized protein YqgC (DUF456 family)